MNAASIAFASRTVQRNVLISPRRLAMVDLEIVSDECWSGWEELTTKKFLAGSAGSAAHAVGSLHKEHHFSKHSLIFPHCRVLSTAKLRNPSLSQKSLTGV